MDTKIRTVTICLAYALAAITFNIAPFMIGAFMDGMALSEASAGVLVTAEMLAMASTGFLLGPWLSSFPRKKILLAGLTILLGANFISLSTGNFTHLVFLRLVSGCGAGLFFVYANTSIARSSNPVRWYGISTVVTAIVSTALILVLPFIVSSLAENGIFTTLIVFGVVLIPLVLSEDNTVMSGAPVSSQTSDIKSIAFTTIALLIIGLICIQTTQTAFYVFAERMATDAGIRPEIIGLTLAVAYVLAVTSSSLAAWIGTRWGRLVPLIIGISAHCIGGVTASLTQVPELLLFGIALETCGFFFAVPYQLGLAAELDKTGRLASVGAGIFFFSLAIGPFLGGAIIESYGYHGVASAVALAAILAVLSFAGVISDLEKRLTE